MEDIKYEVHNPNTYFPFNPSIVMTLIKQWADTIEKYWYISDIVDEEDVDGNVSREHMAEAMTCMGGLDALAKVFDSFYGFQIPKEWRLNNNRWTDPDGRKTFILKAFLQVRQHCWKT